MPNPPLVPVQSVHIQSNRKLTMWDEIRVSLLRSLRSRVGWGRHGTGEDGEASATALPYQSHLPRLRLNRPRAQRTAGDETWVVQRTSLDHNVSPNHGQVLKTGDPGFRDRKWPGVVQRCQSGFTFRERRFLRRLLGLSK